MKQLKILLKSTKTKKNSDDNTIDSEDETSMMNTAYHLERNFNYEESIKQYRRITTVFPLIIMVCMACLM